jgi:hypothetical protein
MGKQRESRLIHMIFRARALLRGGGIIVTSDNEFRDYLLEGYEDKEQDLFELLTEDTCITD